MENEVLNQILSELIKLNQGQNELRAGQASLEAGQDELRANYATLASELQEVKELVILIENGHGQHLKALHDGYRLLYDISQEIRDDIRHIYKHLDAQDARIMMLER